MKKIIFLFILNFCIISGNAQTEINKLKQLLQDENRDTSRVLLLEKLSFAYLNSKPDNALLFAQEALELSRDIGFEKGEAASLNRIGTVLSSIGNYPLALENLFKALAINERINNEYGKMKNLGNIAIIHSDQQDNREALNYSFQEKIIAEKFSDSEALVNTLLSIGDSYEQLGQLDSARFYTVQADSLAYRIKNDDYIGIALNNLGNIYSKLKKTDTAMQYYKLSLHYYENENDDIGICESSLGMARLFLNSNVRDSALHYAKRSLDTARQRKFTKYFLDASQFLSGYYKAFHQMDSAFAYQDTTILAKESLFSQEKMKQIQILSFAEKIRQQEKKEEEKRMEEERRNNLQLIGIATVIISLFLFLLLLSRRKTNAKTVEVFGLIVLLLLFEFVSLYIHPFVEKWTHHTPVFMMLILVTVAAILVPLHHKMEKWVKEKLAHKIHSPVKPAIVAVKISQ
jgi:tetratricopeptide (TPR) repeat protein